MVRYLTIHGHFYQPPRENPYLDKIETQESAYPYHDWNQRVHDECYRPNTCSRVLGEHGRIVDVVNNYEYLSFNFGPTLLNWIEANDDDTYAKIIEADRSSQHRNHGHGNAIAQVYNHLIMPLASERDQRTQIRWGIADFERHFGRKPEGMWLAETAINLTTARLLVEEGIRFTILSPFQADKVRTFFSNTWQDVSSGTIDPTQPYRVFVDETQTKYLDVFFYDAPISSAVSFEHLLRDARVLADRLSLAAMSKDGRPTLVNIATDGESYGHHEPFGDMCLAYFFRYLAPEYQFQLINYAYFLELHPPVTEVVLKSGPNGEGTAWSCSHGVGRWKEDCGCSTGAGAGWDQKWRAPLRDSLNTLRDQLWSIYLTETQPLLRDPVEARHDYYSVFQGKRSADDFWTKHLIKKDTSTETLECLKSLMESQRFSQLMFTSCGWFFADISGIETVQIIKYANIAIRFAQAYTDLDLEAPFIKKLSTAISNVGPDYNGDVIYAKWIKPYELDEPKAVNQYLMEGEMFQAFTARSVFLFDLSPQETLSFEVQDEQFRLVRLNLHHLPTGRSSTYIGLLIGHHVEFQTWVSPLSVLSLSEVKTNLKNLAGAKRRTFLLTIFSRKMGMSDLNYESSRQLMSFLWGQKQDVLIQSLDQVYSNFKELIQSTMMMGGVLPQHIRSIVELLLSTKYEDALCQIEELSPSNVAPVEQLIKTAHGLRIMIKKDQAKLDLESRLETLMKRLEHSTATETFQRAILFLKALDHLDIMINKTVAENIAFGLLQNARVHGKVKLGEDLFTLIEMLNLDMSGFIA